MTTFATASRVAFLQPTAAGGVVVMIRKSPVIVSALLVGALTCASTSAQTSTPSSSRDRDRDTQPQTSSGPERVTPADPGTLPAGQELDVRLQDPLSSETAVVEQRFEATTVVDL